MVLQRASAGGLSPTEKTLWSGGLCPTQEDWGAFVGGLMSYTLNSQGDIGTRLSIATPDSQTHIEMTVFDQIPNLLTIRLLRTLPSILKPLD